MRPPCSPRARVTRWCVAVSVVVLACAGVQVGHNAGLADSSTPRPFDMPNAVTAHATTKKVFAHYFTPFVISLDNKPAATDYYAEGYLDPAGENGAHRSSGGFLRERPLPRPVSTSTTWEFDDMKTDVLRASAAGIDGFTVDMLSLSGYNWDRVKMLMSAAHAADPDFTIMLMPDTTTTVVDDPHALAVAVAGLAAQPAAYHLADGRLVVSPFFAEGRSATWWQSWMATMRTEFGINVAFVPTFLDYANAASFSSISYGYSMWGERSPNSIGGSVGDAQSAHANGKIWMQPIALQDIRPTAGIYTEANNTETLRGLWNIAIGQGAEWVQLVTWNDYSEGTEFSPSSHIGWSPLDLVAYYATAFKTGALPPIVRDVIYLSHRIQPAAALPTGPQTVLMQLRPGSSPARDTVEVLSFLTAPATVVVRVGTASYSVAATAGVSVTSVPLGLGTVSAAITYSNGARLSVTSPFPVVARPVVQDLQYFFVSSARDGELSGVPPSPPVTTVPPTTDPVATAPVATVPPVTVPAVTIPVPSAGVSASGDVAVATPPVPVWARPVG